MPVSWPKVDQSGDRAQVPSIAEQHPVLSGRTLALVEKASVTAARAATVSPTFGAIEAIASSGIEGIHARTDSVFAVPVSGQWHGCAGLIAANRSALQAGNDPLLVHHELLHRSRPEIAGKLRTRQVYIGTAVRVDYVPPAASEVAEHMADLAAFNRRTDMWTIVKAAISHAQFETIHPFLDGNGRTGRALVGDLLRAGGITAGVLPVSVRLQARRDEYVQALTAYRRGDTELIVTMLANAVLDAAAVTVRLERDLDGVWRQWKRTLRGARADSGALPLAESLLSMPVCSSQTARDVLSADNVHRHIATLVRWGILVEHTSGQARNRVWKAPDVLRTVASAAPFPA